MAIWSSEIKELEKLYESFKDQLPDLEKEMERLIKADDENMILLYSRRCLEVIITDLCECELKRPRKTEPLQGIIDKLHKEEKVPSHIIASMHGLNELSTYGAHPKDFDPEQVKPVLVNLDIIIKWYLKYKESGSDIKVKPTEEIKLEIKNTGDGKKNITISRKRLAGILGGSIGVIASVLAVLYFSNIIGGTKQGKGLDKSIAILPFEDFSSNHDQEPFVNGIVWVIYDKLNAITDLDVPSPTTSRIYKNSNLSLKQIADKLDVSYILEGNVQKVADSIRINVNLLDGSSGKRLWSEYYDRGLSTILSVEAEISLNIARELNAILTKDEKDLIMQVPTGNGLAASYYLRGRSYGSAAQRKMSIDMFSKAIEQDPNFSWAYVSRAATYSALYFNKGEYYEGNWEDFDQRAKSDLDKAIHLNPNLPEVKYLQAVFLYRFTQKYGEALKKLDEIENQMSGFTGFFTTRGYILRRLGRWEESIKELNKSIHLDTFNIDLYIENGHTFRLIREYAEAMKFYSIPFDLGILTNLRTEDKCDRFITTLLWKGDLKEALKISEFSNSDLGYINYYGNSYYYYSKEFDKLISVTNKVENQWKYFPKTLNLALVYHHIGNIPMSRNYADSAIAELNIETSKFPVDERYFAALGYAYAYKGDKKNAIENAQKAVNLKPLSSDAWKGFEKEKDLANIYILTGEYDLAMDKIEYLLTIPGDLSVPLLKIDPVYDKLRDLPRFQKILTTEYKTNY